MKEKGKDFFWFWACWEWGVWVIAQQRYLADKWKFASGAQETSWAWREKDFGSTSIQTMKWK